MRFSTKIIFGKYSLHFSRESLFDVKIFSIIDFVNLL